MAHGELLEEKIESTHF
jgi:hypothetical protein